MNEGTVGARDGYGNVHRHPCHHRSTAQLAEISGTPDGVPVGAEAALHAGEVGGVGVQAADGGARRHRAKGAHTPTRVWQPHRQRPHPILQSKDNLQDALTAPHRSWWSQAAAWRQRIQGFTMTMMNRSRWSSYPDLSAPASLGRGSGVAAGQLKRRSAAPCLPCRRGQRAASAAAGPGGWPAPGTRRAASRRRCSPAATPAGCSDQVRRVATVL